MGIFAAAVSRRGWVYFGTYDGRWMGSDGTFVSMFPCRVMILGYIGIVGTLEKIDSLQRTIAHDRQAAADTAFDEASYNAFVAEIDQRVEQRAKELFAKYIADAGDGGPHLDGPGTAGDQTPGAPRGSPEDEGRLSPSRKEDAQA